MVVWDRFKKSLAVTSVVLVVASLSIRSLSAANESNYTYLALGDSIAYGLNVLLLPPPPFTQTPLPTPSQFVGYPEFIGDLLNMTQSGKEVNASCPGETSGSFYVPGAPDYGCHDNGPQGQPPFKTW